MPRIALVTAHAPWFPHMSNFDPAWQPTENTLSRMVYEQVRVLLAGADLDLEVLECDRSYRCGCITHEPCTSYSTALRELTDECRSADLAISVHIDHASCTTRGGAMALYVGGQPARQIALDLVSGVEAQSHIPRRAKHVGDRFIDGCLPYDDPWIRRLYEPKWWLLHGCPTSIILEVAAKTSPEGTAWLRSAGCASQIATSISNAIQRAYIKETEPCRGK